MTEKEPNSERGDLEERVFSSEVTEPQENHRNIFDIIGDFFAKMLKGIFVFVFCKLPVKIWQVISDIEQLKKIFKCLYSILRMVVLVLLWVAVVFLGFWIFMKEKLIEFVTSLWRNVWSGICNLFLHTFEFLKDNAGWIWMILALCGSMYGLLYVTLKRRAKKKGKEFRGVFGWMRRRKKAENGDGNGNEAIPPPMPKE